MVFDVAAESGGALSILIDYYNKAKADTNNRYIFVLSKPNLKETSNVKMLRFAWIKKSWFHRLYFDFFIAPKLVQGFNIDEVFSLQNVIVPYVKVRQILYLHQALPFSDQRFKFSKEPRFWIYQNVIGKFIIQSVKKADQVIVQTQWMKNACVETSKVLPDKIVVFPPAMDINVNEYFKPTEANRRTFFYPASGFSYKNHKVIVAAAVLLKDRGIKHFKVFFTLSGDESNQIAKLYQEVNKHDLPIEFIGALTREEVFSYYEKSVLIFPSYIETFGLPLLEARLHQTPVLASDMPFSHEILDGYEQASFFDVDDAVALANKMEQISMMKRIKSSQHMVG